MSAVAASGHQTSEQRS